jgi:hypothetical protein
MTRANLTLDPVSRRTLSGSFSHGDIELRFDAGTDSDGEHLKLDSGGAEFLTVVESDTTVTETLFGGKLTATTETADLRSVMRRAKGVIRRGKPSTHKANVPVPSVRLDGDQEAVREFATRPELDTFVVLSEALGRMGITGVSVPPSGRLHMLGLASARILKDRGEYAPVEVPPGGVVFMMKHPFQAERLEIAGIMDRSIVDVVDDLCKIEVVCGSRPSALCIDLFKAMAEQFCHPCRDLQDSGGDCFGMCGAGCDCWEWVCGDCCSHPVCVVHDGLCGDCADGNLAACYMCGPGAVQLLIAGAC